MEDKLTLKPQRTVSNDRKQPKNQYEIGFKKPPKDTQFKKGVSGNPKGRPMKTLTPADYFKKVFNKPIVATIDGHQIKVSGMEAGFWQLRKQVLSGDQRALRQFLEFYTRFDISNEKGKVNPQLQGLFDALMRGPVD